MNEWNEWIATALAISSWIKNQKKKQQKKWAAYSSTACIEKQSDTQVAEFTSVLRIYVLKETKEKKKYDKKITQQNKIKIWKKIHVVGVIVVNKNTYTMTTTTINKLQIL